MTLEQLFARVAEAELTWHGLYQDGNTTLLGAGPTIYGNAAWNVRLSGMRPNGFHFFAYGGGATLEAAILAALENAEAARAWKPSPPKGGDILKVLGLTLEEVDKAIADFRREEQSK